MNSMYFSLRKSFRSSSGTNTRYRSRGCAPRVAKLGGLGLCLNFAGASYIQSQPILGPEFHRSASGAAEEGSLGSREVSKAAMSDDGKLLLVAIEHGPCSELLAFNTGDSRLLWRKEIGAGLRSMRLSHDGNAEGLGFAAGGELGLEIRSTATGNALAKIEDTEPIGLFLSSSNVRSVAFSADSSTVYAIAGNNFGGWRIRDGKNVFHLEAPSPEASGPLHQAETIDISRNSLALTRPIGLYISALAPEGASGEAAEPLLRHEIPDADLQEGWFSPNGTYVAAPSFVSPGSTRIWNSATGRLTASISGCSISAVWSSDSKSVTCLTKSAVELHSITNPKQILATAPRERFTGILSGGGNIWLYTVVRDGAW